MRGGLQSPCAEIKDPDVGTLMDTRRPLRYRKRRVGETKGVATRLGPLPITEGPAAGQTILYFQAPWGLQFEAISYPKGMAYEKTAKTKLWDPKNPAE